jgi:hypothetical protein
MPGECWARPPKRRPASGDIVVDLKSAERRRISCGAVFGATRAQARGVTVRTDSLIGLLDTEPPLNALQSLHSDSDAMGRSPYVTDRNVSASACLEHLPTSIAFHFSIALEWGRGNLADLQAGTRWVTATRSLEGQRSASSTFPALRHHSVQLRSFSVPSESV